MKEISAMKPQGLYIHIPFCDHICIYCDFYKMIAKDDLKRKYIDYLIKDLYLISDNDLTDIKTIYIGGGTPTALSLTLIRQLLTKISLRIDLNKIIEFTLECNPKDVTNDLLDLLEEFHVNRLSLGVQSLNNNKLKKLNRNHQDIDVLNALELITARRINVNCDIIYGLQDDNIELIKHDLDILTSYNINHISCYTLIIEDKTILKKMITDFNYKPLSDDNEEIIYCFINDYLRVKGYLHYEVSNYALKGYESKHNLIYWNNEHYLGIGANASYYLNNIRYTNPNNLDKYFTYIDKKTNKQEELFVLKKELNFEELNLDDIIYEEIILGLRKLQGINIKKFYEKYQVDIFSKYPNIINLINNKLLIYENDYLYIPEDKIYVMNQILLKIGGD